MEGQWYAVTGKSCTLGHRAKGQQITQAEIGELNFPQILVC